VAEKVKTGIIHILGASGSGTTTLGQALEQQYGFKWIDTDDIFWLPTDIPFTTYRPVEERVRLMLEAIEENPKCVISGSLCGWGDIFIPRFDLVIYIYTASDIRKERLISREYKRHGERIRRGGDMHNTHINFIEWAMAYDTTDINTRSAKMHDKWLKHLNCTVVKLNGADTSEQHLSIINEFFQKNLETKH